MERGTGCLQKKPNSNNAAGIFVLFQCERRPRKREKKAGEEERESQPRPGGSKSSILGCWLSLEPSPSSQSLVPLRPPPHMASHEGHYRDPGEGEGEGKYGGCRE